MKTKSWQIHALLLLGLVVLLSACGGAAPQPIASENQEEREPAARVEEPVGETQAPRDDDRAASAATVPETKGIEESGSGDSLRLILVSRHSKTEHSEAPLHQSGPSATIDPPPEDSWREVMPNESTEFKSYDGVRVTGEGEAWIDLGDLMHLILKRDSVAQFVPGEDAQGLLAGVEVLIPDATPLLQRLVLGIHLSRGGLIGDKLEQSDTIALTTPNAVIIVSGTQFFLAYNPETDTTIVGNFNGSVDVAATELGEGETLRQRELITIPPLRGRKFWPIHDHLSYGEFERLIDVLESPIAASDMISGPYVVIRTSPGIDVHSGPGTSFPVVGSMDKGQYARILLEGKEWWQIACPDSVTRSTAECWVAARDTTAYNEEQVDLATSTHTPTPANTATSTPVPAAICRVTASSIGLWQGPGAQRGDGGLVYNRVGYVTDGDELLITGEAYGGQWYKVESLASGSEGWVYAPNCAVINDGPIPAASGFLPTLTFTPSPTPTPTFTPTNTPTATPTQTITPTPTGTSYYPYEPSANFSVDQSGLTAYFTNLSTDADSYFWEFGDGTTSSEVNPVHTYVVEGEGNYGFTVTLTAYGPGGSDTITRIDVVSGIIIN